MPIYNVTLHIKEKFTCQGIEADSKEEAIELAKERTDDSWRVSECVVDESAEEV